MKKAKIKVPINFLNHQIVINSFRDLNYLGPNGIYKHLSIVCTMFCYLNVKI